MRKIYYFNRKSEILAALKVVARKRATITYGDLGAQVGGIPPTGPWKGVLDSLAHDETSEGRPDITYLVVQKATGYPAQINFAKSKRPTEIQKRVAEAVWQKVWHHYLRG